MDLVDGGMEYKAFIRRLHLKKEKRQKQYEEENPITDLTPEQEA